MASTLACHTIPFGFLSAMDKRQRFARTNHPRRLHPLFTRACPSWLISVFGPTQLPPRRLHGSTAAQSPSRGFVASG